LEPDPFGRSERDHDASRANSPTLSPRFLTRPEAGLTARYIVPKTAAGSIVFDGNPHQPTYYDGYTDRSNRSDRRSDRMLACNAGGQVVGVQHQCVEPARFSALPSLELLSKSAVGNGSWCFLGRSDRLLRSNHGGSAWMHNSTVYFWIRGMPRRLAAGP